MKHFVHEYILRRLTQLKWLDKTLAEKSGISQGQVSKLKQGLVERLTAEQFYKVYTGFGDSCTQAIKEVYPGIDFPLSEYVPTERNEFGIFMSQFEEHSKNSPEEIAAKTGIDDNRIKNIYFRRGSPEAYELILIEKAIGKNPGELFEAYYGTDEST